MRAGRLNFRIDQHPLHPGRRAGNEAGPALRQQPGVFRMKAVNIAIGRHGIEHGRGIDVVREGELHENPIGGAVGLAGDLVDQRDQGLGRGAGSHANHSGIDPHPRRRIGLAFNVGGAGCHLADQHNHQPRGATHHPRKRRHLGAERFLDTACEFSAVQNRGAHREGSFGGEGAAGITGAGPPLLFVCAHCCQRSSTRAPSASSV